MKKGLVMCRTGMGSSLMLKNKLEKIIEENHFPLELEHDVLSGFVGHHPDVIITMSDLVDEFKDSGCYVIGIKDIMDVDYMTQELKKFFEQSNDEDYKGG